MPALGLLLMGVMGWRTSVRNVVHRRASRRGLVVGLVCYLDWRRPESRALAPGPLPADRHRRRSLGRHVAQARGPTSRPRGAPAGAARRRRRAHGARRASIVAAPRHPAAPSRCAACSTRRRSCDRGPAVGHRHGRHRLPHQRLRRGDPAGRGDLHRARSSSRRSCTSCPSRRARPRSADAATATTSEERPVDQQPRRHSTGAGPRHRPRSAASRASSSSGPAPSCRSTSTSTSSSPTPLLLRRVAAAMVPLVPADTDLLGGLELGGVPIATMMSSLTGLPGALRPQGTQGVRHAPARRGRRRGRSTDHPRRGHRHDGRRRPGRDGRAPWGRAPPSRSSCAPSTAASRGPTASTSWGSRPGSC